MRLRLTAEGERRLARVFASHQAERERLRELLTELDQAAALPSNAEDEASRL
jgi:hypothetical protein